LLKIQMAHQCHHGDEVEVGMDPRHSPKVYPRTDNIFTHKKSLDFQNRYAKVHLDYRRDKIDYVIEFVVYVTIGVLTGLTAAIMSNIEEHVTEIRRNQTDNIIGNDSDGLFTGWLFFAGISCAMVVLASAMTVFWGPGANGSGVAELMGYMNGINYPKVLGFETFVTKVFGVVLAVLGGLCVGKEGPLAHIGGIIGATVVYFPISRFQLYRNDH